MGEGINLLCFYRLFVFFSFNWLRAVSASVGIIVSYLLLLLFLSCVFTDFWILNHPFIPRMKSIVHDVSSV